MTREKTRVVTLMAGGLLLLVAACAAETAPTGTGRLVVRATDADTGEPLTEVWWTGDQTERFVRAIDGSRHRSEAGEYAFDLEAGWHVLDFAARGLRRTRTDRVVIRDGKTTTVDLAFRKQNRIRISVVDSGGRPWPEGTLYLRGDGLKQGLPVKDGVAETPIDVDEVTIHADRRFWPEVVETAKTIALAYGETTEVRFVVDPE